MSEEPLFNPSDPFDASTEDVRKAVAIAATFHMQNHPEYQRLEPVKQFESSLVGMLTATVGCAVAVLEPGSDEALMAAIKTILPDCIRHAHEIIANGEMLLAAQEMKH